MLPVLCAFISMHSVNAQISCDALSVSDVTIVDGNLQVTIYNSSAETIIYPYVTTILEENPYLSMEDTMKVLSLLSVPGDFNDGYTTAWYAGDYAAPEEVPLNTTFTGTLTIGDPNDSTFTCTIPFSFEYGTMTTGVEETLLKKMSLFPNPSKGTSTLSIPTSNAQVELYNQQGALLTTYYPTDTQLTIQTGISGIYFIRICTENDFRIIEWVVQ